MARIQEILHRSNPLIRQFERVASEISPNRSIRLTNNASKVLNTEFFHGFVQKFCPSI
jgi:hypothetical protein